MKRLFQVIGLIGLLAFSFFLTDKTAIVVKNMDEVMQKIKTYMKQKEKMQL